MHRGKSPASPIRKEHTMNKGMPKRDEDEKISAERARIQRKGDEVEIASDDSFPASDPPSFTPVKGEKKDKEKLKEHAKND